MKIVGLIPARGGSKSIPRKNIVPLDGHPLIAYSIAASRLSRLIDRTVVSTDSPEIAEVAARYGADVPFLRPAVISQDHSRDIEFFRHYLEYLQAHGRPVPELIVHLRPTTPLRDVTTVDRAIAYMLEHSEATALRSAHKTHLTPYKMFRCVDGYLQPFLRFGEVAEFYNLPRQVFEDCYIPNCQVDIVRPSILLTTGLLHGERIKLWETDPTIDIDVPEDLDEVRKQLDQERYRALKAYVTTAAASS